MIKKYVYGDPFFTDAVVKDFEISEDKLPFFDVSQACNNIRVHRGGLLYSFIDFQSFIFRIIFRMFNTFWHDKTLLYNYRLACLDYFELKTQYLMISSKFAIRSYFGFGQS